MAASARCFWCGIAPKLYKKRNIKLNDNSPWIIICAKTVLVVVVGTQDAEDVLLYYYPSHRNHIESLTGRRRNTTLLTQAKSLQEIHIQFQCKTIISIQCNSCRKGHTGCFNKFTLICDKSVIVKICVSSEKDYLDRGIVLGFINTLLESDKITESDHHQHWRQTEHLKRNLDPET